MKVLVVLGICVLSAVSAADRGRYCCGKGYQDVPEPEKDNTCVTFHGLIQNITHEGLKELRAVNYFDIELASVAELGIAINAFSKAALECIPNNRIFRNVHAIMDSLHSMISEFPTPDNVMKKITEAQDYMEEHFDDLQALENAFGFGMPSHLLSHIGDFIKEQSRNAVRTFEHHYMKSRDYKKLLEDTNIPKIINTLAERVDDCLGITPNHFDRIFNCRRYVRSVAQGLTHEMEKLRSRSMNHLEKPDPSIESMILKFTAELKDLEKLIAMEKSRQTRKSKEESSHRWR